VTRFGYSLAFPHSKGGRCPKGRMRVVHFLPCHSEWSVSGIEESHKRSPFFLQWDPSTRSCGTAQDDRIRNRQECDALIRLLTQPPSPQTWGEGKAGLPDLVYRPVGSFGCGFAYAQDDKVGSVSIMGGWAGTTLSS
jgi:hypothetical protein